jgi:predicted dithiol-disulfide oxidoreductase (DUF899 family)
MRWPRSGATCPGWRWRRHTASRGRTARQACSTSSRAAVSSIVYRFFYGLEVTTYAEGGSYPERACVGCSFVADQVAHPAHLNARDTTLAFVSRAPQAEIRSLKERMGWDIPWYTLTDAFDADFGVDEWHGTNAFIRDGDRIFRTYLIDSRGDEAMGSTWSYLDITALGRQEQWEDSPEGYPQSAPYRWWNYHDAYGKTA